MDHASAQKALARIGQDHVFRFYEKLEPEGKRLLLDQVSALDPASIAELVTSHVKTKPAINIPADITPVRAFPRLPGPDHRELYDHARARGLELLRDGKVGAFLVAGGQGTRLGYDGPKGEYPITPVKNKPLFQVFAEQLLAHGRDAGKPIPWYVMTSDANDTATRAFFVRHNYFGLDSDDVRFFQQGMMPAFSTDGKMLLCDRASLSLSPDGHGGSLGALHKSGALSELKGRGIEHLSYFQVDNPLVQCIDPLFLGLHDLTGSEMSSKTVPKNHPLEKMGNFCVGDGVLQVIEYSDLPESLAMQKEHDGKLRFNAGSIAIHALRISFIEKLNSGGRLNLPWHRAEKKVAFVDQAGNLIKPEKPNAVKLEQFVFDAIPLAKNAMLYTTDRAEEFSPVKNAEGNDSPTTSRRDQIRRAARWLIEAGVEVPMEGTEPDAILEISPLRATSSAQLKTQKLNHRRIKSGDSFYLE